VEKHIDNLVIDRDRKQDELLAIGKKIAESAVPAVISFIDLSGSTQMKSEREPEDWLGYIFKFIQCVDKLAECAGGVVVKRIGDELMVTFKDVKSSECFLDSLIVDTTLQPYKYKVAVDFGSVYHFRFIESLADDPYGPTVDRCARVAGYAGADTIVCTSYYRNQLSNTNNYTSMGTFTLRGFSKPEELFFRSLVSVDSNGYLKPVVDIVKEKESHINGYRPEGRKITAQFIREFGKSKVRSFLARELLNVPKLPYLPRDFAKITCGTGSMTEKEREFIGYFVEWEGVLENFTRNDCEIIVRLSVGSPRDFYHKLELLLPLNNLDIIKTLEKRQLLRVRGIICNIFSGVITLNYVDMEIIGDKNVR